MLTSFFIVPVIAHLLSTVFGDFPLWESSRLALAEARLRVQPESVAAINTLLHTFCSRYVTTSVHALLISFPNQRKTHCNRQVIV
jgi:hypothetical protein